jgi:epoxyqueuosine reductase
MPLTKDQVLAYAREIGLDLAGVTSPAPFDRLLAEIELRKDAYQKRYASRLDTWRKMADPAKVLPGARSVLVVGFSYLPEATPQPPGCGKIGRIVAYGHLGILQRARRLCAYIRKHGHRAVMGAHRKEAAVRAGLGMVGKHDLVIHPEHGSWVAYQTIVTDAEWAPDTPFTEDLCGDCDRCLRACPTGALYEPRRLDPRRCVTCLLTSAEVAPEYWPAMGSYILGCDGCQEACPRNRGCRPKPSMEALLPGTIGMYPPLADLLRMDETRFQKELMAPLQRKVAGNGALSWLLAVPALRSAVMWYAKRFLRQPETVPETFIHASGNLALYRRNAIVAAGNLRGAELRADVAAYREDPQLGPYAQWAVEQMGP